MRRLVLALMMAVAATIGVVVPGTALALDLETDYAKLGGSPPASAHCAEPEQKVQVCFERGGDVWWVLDRDTDSASALIDWRNYRGDRLYRVGVCINTHGAGTWASCNKNYYEDSELKGHQAYWDRDKENSWTIYLQDWRFQG